MSNVDYDMLSRQQKKRLCHSIMYCTPCHLDTYAYQLYMNAKLPPPLPPHIPSIPKHDEGSYLFSLDESTWYYRQLLDSVVITKESIMNSNTQYVSVDPDELDRLEAAAPGIRVCDVINDALRQAADKAESAKSKREHQDKHLQLALEAVQSGIRRLQGVEHYLETGAVEDKDAARQVDSKLHAIYNVTKQAAREVRAAFGLPFNKKRVSRPMRTRSNPGPSYRPGRPWRWSV